jgi:hypothetical protein
LVGSNGAFNNQVEVNMPEATKNKKWTVGHADHGLTQDDHNHIRNVIENDEAIGDGFFISQVSVNSEVPCGLYGPAMGDDEIKEANIIYSTRGERLWPDRLVHKPFRPVDYVQVIGIKDGEGFEIFTIYGGPEAPQNPEDPNCADVASAKEWWSKHALATGREWYYGIHDGELVDLGLRDSKEQAEQWCFKHFGGSSECVITESNVIALIKEAVNVD